MVKKALTYDDVFLKCASLCAKSEHSAVELIGKMCRWGVPRDMAALVVERLKGEGYVDERRFAHAFVYDKFNLSGWGRTKIRYYLRMNGICDEFADEALAEIDDDDYKKTLARLIAAKSKLLPDGDPYKKKVSLCRYAVSRGFEAAFVTRMVNDLINNGDDVDVPDDMS